MVSCMVASTANEKRDKDKQQQQQQHKNFSPFH